MSATGGGTYTLIVGLDEPATIEFGAAGGRDLRPGWYAYTGSALGPGGFSRIERHRRVAASEHDVRHWHVDSLLRHPAARLVSDVRSAGLDAECAVARRVAGAVDPVAGIGATDCDCGTHLACAAKREPLERTVRRAHRRERH